VIRSQGVPYLRQVFCYAVTLGTLALSAIPAVEAASGNLLTGNWSVFCPPPSTFTASGSNVSFVVTPAQPEVSAEQTVAASAASVFQVVSAHSNMLEFPAVRVKVGLRLLDAGHADLGGIQVWYRSDLPSGIEVTPTEYTETRPALPGPPQFLGVDVASIISTYLPGIQPGDVAAIRVGVAVQSGSSNVWSYSFSMGLSSNAAPVASAQSASTNQGTPVSILLSATDPDGDPLVYSVVSPPSHGALSGTPPHLTYTPAAAFSGSDGFTFKASDGSADSNVAAVSITVTPVIPVNDPPVADPQSVSTDEDVATNITLTGTDPNDDPLAYSIVTPPAHGTLTGTAPQLTYSPDAHYNGSDSFTFRVNDGAEDSNLAAVTLNISPVNDSPAADAGDEQTVEAIGPLTTVTVDGSGSDVDGDPLSHRWSEGATTLGSAATLQTALPVGAHTLTLTVEDGNGGSASDQVVISVADRTPPAIAVPGDITATATSAVGAIVSYPVSANDLVDGSVAVTATPPSGAVFAPGTTLVQCEAIDSAGNRRVASFLVQVRFSTSAILRAGDRSTFKRRSTVPISFEMTGASAGITDAAARLYVTKVSDSVGSEVPAESTAQASEGNLFRYDAATGQYNFNWGTGTLSEGTYQLRVDLGDGVSRTVDVVLK
jgi:hypothetical protein